MIFRIRLIPRFHYTFRLIDIFLSFRNSKKNALLVKQTFGNPEMYFFNSARSGLSVLLKVFSNGKNLRIGVQPFNCETVFKSIVNAGCTPVFIDINSDLTINLNELEAQRHAIDCVIVTHTFGKPAGLEEIRSIMAGKLVIEDCAHAFLSEYKSKLCGTFGDASVFSFNYGKFPSIGKGGFVMLNNDKLKEGFRNLYYRLPKPDFFSELLQPLINYIFALAFKPIIYGMITYPFFKVLDQKLDFTQKYIFKESRGFTVNINVFFNNYKRYIRLNSVRKEKSFHILSKLSPSIEIKIDDCINWYLIPLIRKDRDIIFNKLLNSGYECGKHYSKSVDWAVKYGYSKGSCPIAENVAKNILVLSNVAWLKDEDLNSIVEALKEGTV